MSWRVVVISKRSKLDYKMGSLVVRSEDDEKRVFLDDISVLMCETTAISITAYLLAELTARKIKVIFCDNQHNPASELIPMYGSYVSSGRIREQIAWDNSIKAKVWQKIIKLKITNQAVVLQKAGQIDKAEQLRGYVSQVELGDKTNREGHAAKVYFNALFGLDFYRSISDVRNASLNYGYTILLACFNREIAASGYLTQLGIWHDNAENPFNLGSDLMEPFRPLIDWFTYEHSFFTTFEKDEKMQVLNLLNSKVKIDNAEQYLNNAIGIYARSVFNALNEKDVTKIVSWYEL
jgi:CRISPR-associated endonuclease Cas1 subtype II